MNEAKLKKRIITYTVLAVVLVFTLLILLIFQYTQYWALRDRQIELDRILTELEQEYEEYSQEYDYKSSEEFIEDYARLVLGWGR